MNYKEFYDAAFNGDLQYVENEIPRLATSGFNLDWQNPDKDGWTGLHVAAYNDNCITVSTLLTAGANPNVQDDNGETPLHIAAFWGHNDSLCHLLDPKYQANVNLVDKNRRTALHVAARENKSRIVSALLTAGADPNVQDDDGMTPVCIAAWKGKDSVLSLLMDPKYQADVNLADNNGETPVYRAAFDDRTEALKILLSQGGDPNKVDNDGTSPLLAAAEYNNLECARALLEAGAHVDYVYPDDGRTALHVAAVHDRHDLALVLLEAAASKDKKDNYGKTPAESARYLDWDSLAELIDNY